MGFNSRLKGLSNLFSEVIVLCSKNYTERIQVDFMGKNSEIVLTPVGAFSNQCDWNYKNCFLVLRTSVKLKYNKTYVTANCNICQ
jgi:hypothetical protein